VNAVVPAHIFSQDNADGPGEIWRATGSNWLQIFSGIGDHQANSVRSMDNVNPNEAHPTPIGSRPQPAESASSSLAEELLF
jgi:hypothetical protein